MHLPLISLLFLGKAWAAVPCGPATVSKVFQLDKIGTWFENLAVRENGAILATRLDVPELWQVQPTTRTGKKLLSIPQITHLLGITEVSDDVFVVGGANFTESGGVAVGTAQVWEVNMTGDEPKARLITQIAEAGLPNGITRMNSHQVLVADSTKGVIYKLDTKTGKYSVALNDPETMSIPEGAEITIGVNGIKILKDHVYYTNTARQTFYRTPVNKNLDATGPAEVIASGFLQDDFTLLPDGTAYIAASALNTVLRVSGMGQVSPIAGSKLSIDIASATAVQFGRTRKDRHTLYVTTSGDQLAPVNGTVVVPAEVVAIHLA
ncbi:hypothetical protein NW759_004255 [Fusarium solani]|nr:hypothetical protein NW759_004255 [Fusarium solani]